MDITHLLATTPTDLFIDGEFTPSDTKDTFAVFNPSDGTELARVASASKTDARRALSAAVQASTDWARTPSRERSNILHRAFELIIEHGEELAWLQSLELGRALPDSRAEVTYGAEFFRWFAEEAVRIRGDYRHKPTGTGRIVVTQQPVGPCLAITPWNFPLAMGTRKLGPALAAGCTMIVKPASKTPLTMLYLAKLLATAGVPRGVVAVLPSRNAANVSALLDDPRLRKLTFTGSTTVGQQLAAQAARHSLRVSLELGGNAPYLVCQDADVDQAAQAVAVAKMRGAGQVCIAANRFLVQENIAAEFTATVSDVMAGFRLGRATDPNVTFGALSGADQVATVQELVTDACAQGAAIAYQGTVPSDLPAGGSYFPATVLTQVPATARIAHSEIFGPVVAIQTFRTEEEGIAMANDTPFGLAAYVFAGDTGRALTIAERLEAGMVAVNSGTLSDPAAPFGGVKESGVGREGGMEGISEYLEPKYISLP